MTVMSFPATAALDAFNRDTAGMTQDQRRATFLALPDEQRERIRQEKRAVDYLPNRGFSPATIGRARLGVERIGENRARRYGFGEQSAEAGECWALFIPYPGGPERLRLIDPGDLEKFGGGKYRGAAGSKQALYDPRGCLAHKPDALVLIEGELNLLALVELVPELPAVAMGGKTALKPDLAAQLGGLEAVYVWIDRRDRDPKATRRRVTGSPGRCSTRAWGWCCWCPTRVVATRTTYCSILEASAALSGAVSCSRARGLTARTSRLRRHRSRRAARSDGHTAVATG